MVRFAHFASLALALAACSPAAPGVIVAPPDMALPPGPPDMTWVGTPYPAGPYGKAQGETLFNIYGKGYLLNPNQTDATQLTLQDKVDIQGTIRMNPACTCGILSQSALWCGPCNAEQDSWVDAVNADPSFCPFNVLLQDSNYNPAQPVDLLTWNQRHAQNFPIILSNIVSSTHLPPSNAIPANVIFNPKTMEILDAVNGSVPVDQVKATCAAAGL